LGGKFGDFCRPLINSSGVTIFKANGNREGGGMERVRPLEEEEKNEGIFMAEGENVKKVITGGDPFPGGGEFEIVNHRGLADDGRVFFENSVLEGRAATGIYSILDGKVSTIASLGGPAPESGNFSLVYGNTLTINKAGVALFVALLENGKTGLF